MRRDVPGVDLIGLVGELIADVNVELVKMLVRLAGSEKFITLIYTFFI